MRFSPSTIIPSEFSYLDSYDLGGYDPMEQPPYNTGRCARILDDGETVENHEGLGKCDVCGTRFRYGEVWRHDPTKLLMTIGHQCAGKYGLMASNPEYNRQRAAHIRKVQRLAERRWVRGEMKQFLMSRRDLARHLRADHYIVRDLRAKLIRWGNLSEKQVALAAKIAGELEQRAAVDDAKTYVPVPETDKRIQVEGTVLGIKWTDGSTYDVMIPKMIVECDGDGGVFKLYGTMPEAMQEEIMARADATAREDGLRGAVKQLHPRVRFMARVERSRDDEHFGFFKRPTRSEVI